MVYSDEEVANLVKDGDELVPDQEKDIKPFFHRSTKKGGNSGESNSNSGNEEVDSEEEDFEEEDDDEEVSEWSIRKCAAAGLDLLSIVFQDALLPSLLQNAEAMLNDKQNWRVRECAVLALGAVAEGCAFGIRDHLSKLVPFLMSFIGDSHVSRSYFYCF